MAGYTHCKSNDDVLAVFKRQLQVFVGNPTNGASRQQQDGFDVMLASMCGSLADYLASPHAVEIPWGLPAGVASLVVSVQPLLTAIGAGFLLGATVSLRQWLGLLLGLAGVGLVVWNKLGQDFGATALIPALVALLAITAGTLYQKKFCPVFDWRTGAVAQFLPTTLLTGLIALLTENFRIEWTGELFFALGWLVLVLSIGAVSLLNWLIRHSNAVNVASLFYLVPPCTALFAWALFGNTLSGLALAGMALTVWGVYLARK